MPKLCAYGESETVKRISKDLTDRFGYLLTLENIRQTLGAGSRNTAVKWVAGMESIIINGRKKYMAPTVAQKIYDSRR